MDDVPEEMYYFRNNQYYMRKQKDRRTCIALQNGLCTIYENRPTECKQFEAGNPRCKDLFRKAVKLDGVTR